MDRSVVELLVGAAAQFTYLKERLAFATATTPTVFAAHGVAYSVLPQAELSYPEFGTGIAEDLRSELPGAPRLGFLSVIFWGHISRNREFALHKAKLAAQMAEADFHAHLAAVIAHVDRGEFGQALIACAPLHGIGSTSFASKLVACLAPEHCGVFDQQIYRYLARLRSAPTKDAFETWLDAQVGPWAWTAQGTFGASTNEAMARGYQAWCAFLSDTAAQLNARQTSSPWFPVAWRAVDVERAIFARATGAARGQTNDQNRRSAVGSKGHEDPEPTMV